MAQIKTAKVHISTKLARSYSAIDIAVAVAVVLLIVLLSNLIA